jgi:hypothetical protein
MTVNLISPGGFDFSQTNAWPLEPKTGFPTTRRPEPEQLWHLTAATRHPVAKRRIAAIMNVGTRDEMPSCDIRVEGSQVVRVHSRMSDGEASVRINLKTVESDDSIFEVSFRPAQGKAERLVGR